MEINRVNPGGLRKLGQLGGFKSFINDLVRFTAGMMDDHGVGMPSYSICNTYSAPAGPVLSDFVTLTIAAISTGFADLYELYSLFVTVI